MMIRFLIALSGLGVLGAQVSAEELELKLKFSERYLACARENPENDSARLGCYDALMVDLPRWLEEGFEPVASCEVEEWNMQYLGDKPIMTGAVTCATGWLTYRIYDGETGAFLTSGRALIDGFAFRDLPMVRDWPETADLKYSISE